MVAMIASETSFYVTGGTLRHDAPSYVERAADRELYGALTRGEFCYVLTPRQSGKSSLMVRTAARLRAEGIAVAVLDLTAIGQNLTPEQWYGGLLERIAQQLSREEELDRFWHAHSEMDPLHRWMAAIQAVALQRSDEWKVTSDEENRSTRHSSLVTRHSPLVIFIDEIDTIRSLSFPTEDFFAAIRESCDRRSAEPDLHRLTFCLLGVALPTDLAPDPRHSPFRIGRRIPLEDFTESEALPLARGLAPAEHKDTKATEPHEESNQCKDRPDLPYASSLVTRHSSLLLRRILHWTGGHPYLTQRLCRAVAEDGKAHAPVDVDRVCERLFLAPGASERDDNLIFVRERLLRSDTHAGDVLHLYARLRSGQTVREDTTDPRVRVLRLSGITRTAGGRLRVRNRIYERIFDRRWVRKNMPDAEVRRQRAAFRRGLLGATAVVSAVAAVLIGLLLTAPVQHPLKLSQRLPDGTTLRLEAITYGTQHHFEAGHFRLAWLQNLFPLPTNLISPAFDFGTSRNAVVFWLSRRDSAGRYRDFSVLSHVAAVDEHGCRFELPYQYLHVEAVAALSRQNGDLTTPIPPGARCIMLYGELPSYPRRAKAFRLRIYDQSDRPIAEFSVPNPAPAAYPTWKPEPLPVTKRDGSLAVTLTGLTSQLQGGSTYNNREMEQQSLVPAFSIRENGKLTHVWENGEFTIRDATGNSASTASGGSLAGFCLYEPAWKLRAKFWRTPQARFAPSETWIVRGVPVPKDGALTCVANSTTLQGARLQLMALAGAGTVEYVNAVPRATGKSQYGRNKNMGMGLSTSSGTPGSSVIVNGRRYNGPVEIQSVDSGLPHVGLQVTGLTADQRLTLKAVDNRGRQISVFGSSSTGDARYLQLNIPPDARKVDLIFAVQKSRVAEFTVRPPRAWCYPEFQLEQPGTWVPALAFSPDGKTLAVASGSPGQWAAQPGAVTLWDLGTIETRAVLEGHLGLVDAVAFSPDGQTIATGSYDHTVRLWRAASARPLAVLHGHTGPVRGLAFARDGKTLATAGEDGAAILWDLKAHKPRVTIRNEDGGLACVALSPDGKTLAAGLASAPGRFGIVKLWDVTTGKVRAVLRRERNEYDAIAFSPDGKTLAVGNLSCAAQFLDVATARVRGEPRWDPSTGELRGALLWNVGPVQGIAFSPDRRLLATAEGDSVKLWDAATGQDRGALLNIGQDCRSIAFSPDGQLLAVGMTKSRMPSAPPVPSPPLGQAQVTPPGVPPAPPGWTQAGVVKLWRVISDPKAPLAQ
jgi:WD40 repeat protein